MYRAAPNGPKAKRSITGVLYIAALMLMLQSASAGEAQEKARPEFVFGYSIKTLPDVDINDATAALDIYLKKLASKLQISAESMIYQDIEPMLKDTLEGRLDLFSLSAMEYLQMEAKIQTVRGKTGIIGIRGGKTTDRLLLLVHKGAPVATLGDLSGRKVTLLKGDEIAPLFLNLLLLREGQPEMPVFFFSGRGKIESIPGSSLRLLRSGGCLHR